MQLRIPGIRTRIESEAAEEEEVQGIPKVRIESHVAVNSSWAYTIEGYCT